MLQNFENSEISANYEARTLQLLGILYFNNKNFAQSVHCFQRLLLLTEKFQIESIRASFIVGKIVEGLLKQAKPLLAKPYLEDLVRLEKNSENFLQFGKVLIALNDLNRALQVLQEGKGLTVDPSEERFKILTTLALVQVRLNDFKSAKTTLNDCIKSSEHLDMPPSSELLWVFTQLGQIYYTEESTLSEEILQRAKMMSEDLQVLDIEYGNILLLLGKLKAKSRHKTEALVYLTESKKVLEGFGKDQAIETQLSILKLHLNDLNVMKTWEILQEIEKNQYSPLISALCSNELGNLLREFNHLSQSLHYYEAALDKYSILKGPESEEVGKVLFNIGSLLHKQGKYTQALEVFSKCQVIKLKFFSANSPEIASLYVEVGECLVKVGKKAYGREMIEKGMKILR
jgi:tetratricopeptide (TPR) repeat protein